MSRRRVPPPPRSRPLDRPQKGAAAEVERIRTLHPQGKTGVHISRAKYDQVRALILELLGRHGETTFMGLGEEVAARLGPGFDGSPMWYYISVKLDLEARGLLTTVPGKGPQRIRLTRPPQDKEKSMLRKINFITVYVRNEDEALEWYTNVLGYEKRTDLMTAAVGGMRWLTVAPKGQTEVEVVLQAPNTVHHGPERAAALTELIGKGTPTVVETDDIQADYDRMVGLGVQFTGEIEVMPWGKSAIFTDLYGNLYNMVQRAGR